MASYEQFPGYPKFGDDVPSAPLPKISLRRLSTGDENESKALFESCRSLGFFLLDLSDEEAGEALVQDIDALLSLARETMALPEDEKMEYHANPPQRLFGYKALGFMKTETKQPDRCKFFMLSQDELTGLVPAPAYPPLLNSRLSVLESFLAHVQPLVKLICRVLSTSLHLPPDTLFEKQRPDAKSGTLIRLIKYPAATTEADRRTALLPHTDMGTMTLLAGVLGGLQVLRPTTSTGDGGEEVWEHIKPEPKCLIVNMGDAIVKWTGGVLRSSVHRVTYPPGDQAAHDRYSIAYLIRASSEHKYATISGRSHS